MDFIKKLRFIMIKNRWIFLNTILITILGLNIVLFLSRTSNAASNTNPNHSHLYVAEQDSNAVNIMDTTTLEVTKSIRVGQNPSQLVINSTGSTVYVAFSGGIDVIDTSTNAVTSTIQIPQVAGFILSPDSSKLYVTDGDHLVFVINTANNQIIATIDTQQCGTNNVAINPSGTKLYVINGCSSNFQAIETSTNQIINTVQVPAAPTRIKVSTDGSKIYVTQNSSNDYSVYNASDNSLIASLSGTGANDLVIKPDGTRAYIGKEGFIDVIDTSNNTLISRIRTCAGLALETITTTGSIVYATCSKSHMITSVDTSTNTEISTFQAEFNPLGIVFKQ